MKHLIRKFTSVSMVLLMLLTSTVSAYAEETETPTDTNEPQITEVTNNSEVSDPATLEGEEGEKITIEFTPVVKEEGDLPGVGTDFEEPTEENDPIIYEVDPQIEVYEFEESEMPMLFNSGRTLDYEAFYWIPALGEYISIISGGNVCLYHGGLVSNTMTELGSIYEVNKSGTMVTDRSYEEIVTSLYAGISPVKEEFASGQTWLWVLDGLTAYEVYPGTKTPNWEAEYTISASEPGHTDPTEIGYPRLFPSVSNMGTQGISGWLDKNGSYSSTVTISSPVPSADNHSYDSTLYVDWDLDKTAGQFRVTLPYGTFEEGGYTIETDPGLHCDWTSSKNSSSATIGCSVDKIWNQDKEVRLVAHNSAYYEGDTKVVVEGNPTWNNMLDMMAHSMSMMISGAQQITPVEQPGRLRHIPYSYGGINLKVHLYTAELDVNKISEYGEQVVPGQEYVLYMDMAPYAHELSDNSIGEEDTLIQDVAAQNASTAGTNGNIPFKIAFDENGKATLQSQGTREHNSVIYDLLPRNIQSDTSKITYTFRTAPSTYSFTVADEASRWIDYNYWMVKDADGNEIAEPEVKTALVQGIGEIEVDKAGTYEYQASLSLNNNGNGTYRQTQVDVWSAAGGYPLTVADESFAINTLAGYTVNVLVAKEDETGAYSFEDPATLVFPVQAIALPTIPVTYNYLAYAVIPENGIWHFAEYVTLGASPIALEEIDVVWVNEVGNLTITDIKGNYIAISTDPNKLNQALENGTVGTAEGVYLVEMDGATPYKYNKLTGVLEETKTVGAVQMVTNELNGEAAYQPGKSTAGDIAGTGYTSWYYTPVNAEGKSLAEVKTVEIDVNSATTTHILTGEPGESITLSDGTKATFNEYGNIELTDLAADTEYTYTYDKTSQKRFYYVLHEVSATDAYEINGKNETIDLPFWNNTKSNSGVSACYFAGGEDGPAGTTIPAKNCAPKTHTIVEKELRTAIDLIKYDVDSSTDGGLTYKNAIDNAFYVVKDVTFTVPGNGKLDPADPNQASGRPEYTNASPYTVAVGYTGTRWLQAVDPDVGNEVNHRFMLKPSTAIILATALKEDGTPDLNQTFYKLYSDGNGMINLDDYETYTSLQSAKDATILTNAGATPNADGTKLPGGTYYYFLADKAGVANAYSSTSHMEVIQIADEAKTGELFIDFLKYGHTYQITEYEIPSDTRTLNETTNTSKRVVEADGYVHYVSTVMQSHYFTISSDGQASAYSDTLPQNSGVTFSKGNAPVYEYDTVKGVATNENFVEIDNPTHEYFSNGDVSDLATVQGLTKKQSVNDGWTLVGDYNTDGSVVPNDGSFIVDLSTKDQAPVFWRKDNNGDWIVVEKNYIDDTTLLLAAEAVAAARYTSEDQDGFTLPAVFNLGWANKRVERVSVAKRNNEVDFELLDNALLMIENISNEETIDINWTVKYGRTGMLNINGIALDGTADAGATYEYSTDPHFKSVLGTVTLDENGFASVEAAEGTYYYRNVEDKTNLHTTDYVVEKGKVDLGVVDWGSEFRITEIEAPDGYYIQDSWEFQVLAEKYPDYTLEENYVNKAPTNTIFKKYDTEDASKKESERTLINGAKFDFFTLSGQNGEASKVLEEKLMNFNGGVKGDDLRVDPNADVEALMERLAMEVAAIRADDPSYLGDQDPTYLGTFWTGYLMVGNPGETYRVSTTKDFAKMTSITIADDGYAKMYDEELGEEVYFTMSSDDFKAARTAQLKAMTPSDKKAYEDANAQNIVLYVMDGAGEVTEVSYIAGGIDLGAVLGDAISYGDTIYAVEVEAPKGYQTGNSKLYTLHADKYTGQYIILEYYEAGALKTTATDAKDGDHIIDVESETITINDLVEYTGLNTTKEYKLTGTLHIKNADGTDGGVIKDANGDPITAEKIFTPKTSAGKETVTFEVPVSALPSSNTKLVVFETLYEEGIEFGVHADIEDLAQTVTVSTFRTSLRDGFDDDKVVNATTNVTLIDTVSYAGLDTNTEYELTGTIHINEDGVDAGTLKNTDGSDVTATVRFTPTAGAGKVDVTFEFAGSNLYDGEKLVAYEVLKPIDKTTGEPTTDESLIKRHEDINDKDQTVEVVYVQETIRMQTTATGDNTTKLVEAKKNAQIVDKITYAGTVAGETYLVKGELHLIKKAEDGTLVDGGVLAKAETEFIAQRSNGTLTMTFKFDSSQLSDGTKVVVFEEMYIKATGELVSEHKDINDKDQTVEIGKDRTDPPVYGPDIHTMDYNVEDGYDTVKAKKNVKVNDIVYYEGLTVGQKYTVEGSLVIKETGETVAYGSTTFTAASTAGQVEVSFTFDATGYNEMHAVAFEDLYGWSGETKYHITDHKDINDDDQTILISNNPWRRRRRVRWIRTGAGESTVIYSGLGISAMLALVWFVIKNKKKTAR